MRLFYFITTLSVLVLLSTAPSFAADKPSSGDSAVHSGSLMCFSIASPGKGLAYVGLKMNGTFNPEIGCTDAVDPAVVAGC